MSLYEETEIPRERIKGPLDLESTLMSGQTGEPQWDLESGCYADVDEFSGKAAKYRVRQAGTTDEPHLKVTIASEDGHAGLAEAVADHIARVLRLDDDLNVFFEKSR